MSPRQHPFHNSAAVAMMKVDSERHWEKKATRKRDVRVSQVDKWEMKEGDTHMSVHDQLRHR